MGNATSATATEEEKNASMSKVSLESFDFFAFHSPYGKLVQKGYARLVRQLVVRTARAITDLLMLRFYSIFQLYNDYLSNPTHPLFATVPASFLTLPRHTTLLNKDVEKVFVTLSAPSFAAKVFPTTLASKKIGNMYTASLYGSLASLLDSTSSEDLEGKRIGMYSYGSGLAASFFSLRVRGSTKDMQVKMDLKKRLEAMTVRSCEEYVEALKVCLYPLLLSNAFELTGV